MFPLETILIFINMLSTSTKYSGAYTELRSEGQIFPPPLNVFCSLHFKLKLFRAKWKNLTLFLPRCFSPPPLTLYAIKCFFKQSLFCLFRGCRYHFQRRGNIHFQQQREDSQEGKRTTTPPL